MGISQNFSGLKRDGRALAIALKVLTRRFLRRGARYGEHEQTVFYASKHVTLSLPKIARTQPSVLTAILLRIGNTVRQNMEIV